MQSFVGVVVVKARKTEKIAFWSVPRTILCEDRTFGEVGLDVERLSEGVGPRVSAVQNAGKFVPRAACLHISI